MKTIEDRIDEWLAEPYFQPYGHKAKDDSGMWDYKPARDILREAAEELRRLRKDLDWYHKERDRLIWEAKHWPKMMEGYEP